MLCLQSNLQQVKPKTKQIGLLATPATTNNKYIQKLIKDHANDIEVHLYSSVNLVTLAEHKFWRGEVNQLALKEEIENLNISKEIDYLVLGCTHFPILSSEIHKALDMDIELIDSGNAIANRVIDVLPQNRKDKKSQQIKRPVRFYATDPIQNTKQRVKVIKLIDL